MKIFLIVIISLAGIVALVTVAGLLLPREHVAASEITIKQPIDSVWAVLRDFGGLPKWSNINVSERVTGAPGERWRQESGGQKMQIDVVDESPPHRFTTKIVEEKGAPFGGTWTFVFTSTSNGTSVTITENGWVGPPPFRVIGRLMGTHGTMDGMLTALAKRFGESAKPVHR